MRHLFLRLRSLRANQRGAAAIEFAIIAPVFFALLLSAVDVGRYMWTLNTMQYAIDEAVRAGAVQELTDNQIEDRVIEALLPVSSTPITVSVDSGSDSVTVVASSTYHFFFPISSFLSGADINLRTEMPF